MVKNQTKQLDIVLNNNEKFVNNIQYTSSNEKVATVDRDGKVTAISTEKAVETCNVEVTQNSVDAIEVEKIVLSESTLNLNEQEVHYLDVKINPSTASNQELTWANTNSKVATVEENGNVIALSPGTAIITVKSDFCK